MSPSVTVLLGPARCGKTHVLVSQYRQVLQAAEGAVGRGLWLAPTARATAAIREELLRDGLRACLDPGVRTFDTLAGRVLSTFASPPRAMTPLVERVLLRRVIDAAVEMSRLKVLADAARRSSFVQLVDEHIHELKRHGVTPAAFARSIGSRGDRSQHEELALLYAEYERLVLKHRLVDQEGRHWAVRDALANDDAQFADLAIVVADGFADFTRTQLEILQALTRRSGRLLVALPDDTSLPLPPGAGRGEGASGRTELFAKSAATLAELRWLFPKLDVERLPDRATAWPALDHVARHLFAHPRDVPAPPPPVIDSLDRLEIVEAAGAQDEVVELARHVKRRLIHQRQRTGTARPGDVVVVFRNLREAAPRVRDVFDEFGIPHSLEAGVPLAATGIVRTLLDVVRLDAQRWQFRRVVSVVTNHLLTAVDPPARAAAEWLIRDLQIAQGRDRLLQRVDSLAGELAAASGHPTTHRDRQVQAAALAAPLLRELAAALDELPDEAAPTAWIAAFTQLGERLGIRCLTSGPLGSSGGPLGSSASEPPADEDDHTAWQCVAEHFASLERFTEWLDEPALQLSREAVLDLLVDLAKNESLPRRFDDTGRVRVLSAATARTVDAKHLFLAGMSEQAFPAPERAGKLYSEADYRFFGNVADQSPSGAERPTTERSQDEMLLFYEVLTRAGERLTITYPALDEKAQVLSPSPYVTEVERTINIPEAVTHRRATRPSPLPNGTSPLGPTDWRIQAVSEALQGQLDLLAGLFRSGAAGSAIASRSANGIEAALRIIAARSRRDAFGPAEGLLESEAVRARLARRFGSEHAWSPSQWERYALCPYKFFMSDVLAREPLGELVLETDHRRRGTLVHRVLAEFHRRLPELLGTQTNLSAQEAARVTAEFGNILDALARATPHVGIEEALVELDRRQIAKWGPRYHAERGKYDAAWPQLDAPLAPTYLEWRFGPPRLDETDYEDPRSTSEPLMLDLGNEQIRVTGRIDRIDVGQSAGRSVFNVIDYKSGNRPSLSEEKIASGERLQPALYVMAAQALLFEGDAATPLWAGYWSMANGVNVDPRFSLECSQDLRSPSEHWETLRASVVKQVGHFVRDIRLGNFPVVSRDDDCTSRCEFSTVCRIGQVRSLGKQWFPDESKA